MGASSDSMRGIYGARTPHTDSQGHALAVGDCVCMRGHERPATAEEAADTSGSIAFLITEEDQDPAWHVGDVGVRWGNGEVSPYYAYDLVRIGPGVLRIKQQS